MSKRNSLSENMISYVKDSASHLNPWSKRKGKHPINARLHVTVKEARDLAPRERHLGDISVSGLGSPDPYCVLRVGNRKFRTSAVSNSLRPQWNEGPFIFDRLEGLDSLEVKIRNKVSVGKGYLFGEAAIPLSSIPSTPTSRDLYLSRSGSKTNAAVTLVLHYEVLEKKDLPIKNGQESETEADDNESVSSSTSTMTVEERRKARSAERRMARETEKALRVRKMFGLQEDEEILEGFSAALLRRVLHMGRVYLLNEHLCFSSAIVGIRIEECIPLKDITDVRKESRSTVSPGVTVYTNSQRELHFTCFENRISFYDLLNNLRKGDDDLEDVESTSFILPTAEHDDEDGKNKHSLKAVTLPFPVEQVVRHLLEDSDFTLRFHQSKGNEDIQISPWTPYPRQGNTRSLLYRQKVSDSEGNDRYARIAEVQRLECKKDTFTLWTSATLHDPPFYSVDSLQTFSSTDKNCKWTFTASFHSNRHSPSKGKLQATAFQWMTADAELWQRMGKTTLTNNSRWSQLDYKKIALFLVFLVLSLFIWMYMGY